MAARQRRFNRSCPDTSADICHSFAGAAARQNHFDADYNLRRAEWEAAWAEARVPPADVPNLRARLAQIFGMAAAWGFVAEVRSLLL